MKRRLVISIAAVFLYVLYLQAQQQQLKPGVERWPIKTSAPKLKDTPKVVSFEDLIAVPNPTGVAKDDARYQKALIPHFDNALNVDEGQIVQVTGWLHLIALETDGDYHIQMSNSDTSGNHCLIVELPYPNFVKSSKALKQQCTVVRNYIKKNILGGQEPSSEGTVLKKAVFVTVTGQFFYDDAHVNTPPRGKKGMHAATLWELHPVTNLKLAQSH
jgi:hypothetical protein